MFLPTTASLLLLAIFLASNDVKASRGVALKKATDKILKKTASSSEESPAIKFNEFFHKIVEDLGYDPKKVSPETKEKLLRVFKDPEESFEALINRKFLSNLKKRSEEKLLFEALAKTFDLKKEGAVKILFKTLNTLSYETLKTGKFFGRKRQRRILGEMIIGPVRVRKGNGSFGVQSTNDFFALLISSREFRPSFQLNEFFKDFHYLDDAHYGSYIKSSHFRFNEISQERVLDTLYDKYRAKKSNLNVRELISSKETFLKIWAAPVHEGLHPGIHELLQNEMRRALAKKMEDIFDSAGLRFGGQSVAEIMKGDPLLRIFVEAAAENRAIEELLDEMIGRIS